MANDNHEPEQEVRKMCPMLDKWCIGDACAMRPEMIRSLGGIQKKFRVCWVDALVILLSEINAHTKVVPGQKMQMQIPKGFLFKG